MQDWLLFFCDSLIVAMLLYIPGLLLTVSVSRSFGLREIAISPLVSVCTFSGAGIVTSGLALAFPAEQFIALVGSAVILLSIFLLLFRRKGRITITLAKNDVALLVLYLMVALVVVGVLFVRNLDGPNSFDQSHDNVTHLNIIHYFMVTGDYSFSCDPYSLLPEGSSAPLASTSGFYPSGWHLLTALPGALLSIGPAMAESASLLTFFALCNPLSMLYFLRMLFMDNDKTVAIGSFSIFSFAAFPWLPSFAGPLYPFVVSCLLLPGLISAFADIFESLVKRELRISDVALFFVAVFGLVVIHPSAVFVLAVILLPFLVQRVGIDNCFKVKHRCAMGLLVAFLFSLFWTLCYKLPFLQSTVSFVWEKVLSPAQAITNLLTLSFMVGCSQLVLSAFVIIGAFRFLKARSGSWVIVSCLLGSILYFVAASTDIPIKNLLTGFWYTDSNRVAAICVLAAVPLACSGIEGVSSFLGKSLVSYISGGKASSKSAKYSMICITVFLAIFIFYPNYEIPGKFKVNTGFGCINSRIQDIFNTYLPNFYSKSEQEFVNRVRDCIGTEALVLNSPEDGSFFAGSISGLSVYYKTPHVSESSSETWFSKVIRTRLRNIASDGEVEMAVRETGAEYVLILGQGGIRDDEHPYYLYYEPSDWAGINGIEDDTPGFETVLADGANRLYRIIR